MKERNYLYLSSRKDSSKTENDSDDVHVNEEQLDEDYVINACTKGDLEAVQSHFQSQL